VALCEIAIAQSLAKNTQSITK